MTNTNFNNIKMREAHIEFCEQLQPRFFITLATNRTMSFGAIRRLARKFLLRLDRKMLGKNAWKKFPSERMDGVFYAEHLKTNAHLHGLVRAPYCNHIGIQFAGGPIWKTICSSGSFDARDIGTVERRAGYSMKESQKYDFFESQYFVACEFMNRHEPD